ncbi:50S ribosomal protein L9 [Desulfobulbus oligotrophicus]|jgi:large subunit ribosomal protein L9|uniref:Large ribosomal subunit protein bL9 n=1 Tax=Desulfobulbus oligotrophicus TaxID=1909699 RepID=A0A7T6AR57_9BACT|nr:50S ribosomal protein L9 [Desulfobulbus oligotrophicus]MDY0390627.1 50S ribosomal protein L9 [Desulfobulbus oligotrophicus]QQG66441.1 50S ribosomal protein L9 [Desulfobulbus oligotrophicus]
MEIILKETIETLGREGDVVNVKPGYARNFLIPQQKAVLVTKASLAQLENEKQAIAARLAEQQKEAEGLAAQLEGKVVVLDKRVGSENRLFGSVTTNDIAVALQETGITVDRRAVVLPEPIKTIGEFKVTVKTGYQTFATVLVQVVPENIEGVQ